MNMILFRKYFVLTMLPIICALRICCYLLKESCYAVYQVCHDFYGRTEVPFDQMMELLAEGFNKEAKEAQADDF
jgi:hypothetical protein